MPNLSRTYRVFIQALPTGERLPLLVNDNTGIPPTLALRYVLARRRRGSSERLRILLRGISDLYEWFDRVAGFNLDAYILAGNTLSTEWLERALTEINSLPRLRTSKSDIHKLADESSCPPLGARANNSRIRAWKDFLIWVLYPKNYYSNIHTTDAPDGPAARRVARFDLEMFFEEFCLQEPTIGHRSGLTDAEIEAITLAIGPGENGFPPDNQFAENTRLRNWVMYCTARWGGLRRGELLKLKVTDIPRRIKHGLLGELQYTDYAINVVRRPDDPDDPRIARRPSVKRGDRSVVLPETLLDDLNSYIDRRENDGVISSYLFVSESGQPLSVERCDDVIKQIGRYAGSLYEVRHPGKSHTLFRLSWHRLRHTRAIELLPLFIEAGARGMDEFLEYFGWASFESATPYLRDLHRDRAGIKVRDFNRQLDDYDQVTEHNR
jgi:integrase